MSRDGRSGFCSRQILSTDVHVGNATKRQDAGVAICPLRMNNNQFIVERSCVAIGLAIQFLTIEFACIQMLAR